MADPTGTPLTLCQHTMLVAILTQGPVDTDQLLHLAPHSEPALCVADVGEWFDELKGLLDRRLIVREPAPHGSLYQATYAASAVVYGYLPTARFRRAS